MIEGAGRSDLAMDLKIDFSLVVAYGCIEENDFFPSGKHWSGITLRTRVHIKYKRLSPISDNPGYDHFVIRDLDITHPVERVLLHGVSCSGGLAALRTGANLALGHTARRKPARVLCVALEISTTLVRSELDSIHELQEMRIGACLFSDCASAVVLSNGIDEMAEPIYNLLGWNHRMIPDTKDDLGFDLNTVGMWPIA